MDPDFSEMTIKPTVTVRRPINSTNLDKALPAINEKLYLPANWQMAFH